jgi:dipeptidyl aminopeptidase/acylaminoacyl peptidase
MKRATTLAALGILAASIFGQTQYRPSSEQLAESYRRADEIARAAGGAIRLQLVPNWVDNGQAFIYRRQTAAGGEFLIMDCASGDRKPAFDHARLAAGLQTASGETAAADSLALTELALDAGRKNLSFTFRDRRWTCSLDTYEVKAAPNPQQPPRQGPGQGGQGGQNRSQGARSPDGKAQFSITEGKLKVVSTADQSVLFESPTDAMAAAYWAPDSRKLAAFRVLPGDRKQVHFIRSSPTAGGRATLTTRDYDLPGDKLDSYETYVIDLDRKAQSQALLEPIVTGGRPFAGPPTVEWWRGGKSFLIDFFERGYQRFRVVEVDLATAALKTVIDETEDTFVDTTALLRRNLPDTMEFIWRSERDGFGRLYLLDANTGAVKNAITPAGWVVRTIEWVDEAERRLAFTANCTRDGEDPYFIHAFTVKLDGTSLIRLTDGNGTHRIQWSPDRKNIIDTYSRVDAPPVHELRRVVSGKLVEVLETADVSGLKTAGIPMPEVFVAKGRDGVTDIWGVVFRPTNFDPALSYPVIENLYAGPQDSFVPKSFTAVSRMQRLAELGFIVVQIDGMGTRNRGKAFHDVCWKNLGDAGFPDRILWMKALAAKMPQADISRVGVYGTSAGGQSSTGALLFHPDFYKVAVSACGCHDNRMDKFWWNEQWMGYPVGPHYEAQSNITNAGKLKGRLLLMVGEADTNVPPESTYRLVDALIKSGKDFDFILLPGMGHTDGGNYGERRRRDYFVRHLLGVEPPDWNGSGLEARPDSGEPADGAVG